MHCLLSLFLKEFTEWHLSLFLFNTCLINVVDAGSGDPRLARAGHSAHTLVCSVSLSEVSCSCPRDVDASDAAADREEGSDAVGGALSAAAGEVEPLSPSL